MIRRAPPSQGVPDEELVRRILAPGDGRGAAAAAETLFGRYRPRVLRWCLRFVRDPDRALDLTQDILLSAWRGLPRRVDSGPFACWLYVIARNRCCSAMRPVGLSRDEEADPDDVAGPGDDPLARLERAEDEESALRLLTRVLDRTEQDALYLRCWERLPVVEITRQLRLRNATGARGLLQTARRKLRTALERRARAESEPRWARPACELARAIR